MGMFDSIYAPCPKCNILVETQSKRGDCSLKRYHVNSVPFEIAQDINGNRMKCRGCGTEFTLRIGSTPSRVTMVIITNDNDWD